MIQHVHERVSRARRIDRVLVATDDDRIAGVVRGFGGEAVMTSPNHATGTDRLAEAAALVGATIVVNVQGDEPMIDPAWIDAAVEPLLADRRVEMATLSLPLRDLDEMAAPSVVKVVTDDAGDALYFSRSPIPYVRLDPPERHGKRPWRPSSGDSPGSTWGSTSTGARRWRAFRLCRRRPWRWRRGSSSCERSRAACASVSYRWTAKGRRRRHAPGSRARP